MPLLVAVVGTWFCLGIKIVQTTGCYNQSIKSCAAHAMSTGSAFFRCKQHDMSRVPASYAHFAGLKHEKQEKREPASFATNLKRACGSVRVTYVQQPLRPLMAPLTYQIKSEKNINQFLIIFFSFVTWIQPSIYLAGGFRVRNWARCCHNFAPMPKVLVRE